MSAGDGIKRVQTPRVLTKELGEIHLMEVDAVKSFLDYVDSILLTDCAFFIEEEKMQNPLHFFQFARGCFR